MIVRIDSIILFSRITNEALKILENVYICRKHNFLLEIFFSYFCLLSCERIKTSLSRFQTSIFHDKITSRTTKIVDNFKLLVESNLLAGWVKLNFREEFLRYSKRNVLYSSQKLYRSWVAERRTIK